MRVLLLFTSGFALTTALIILLVPPHWWMAGLLLCCGFLLLSALLHNKPARGLRLITFGAAAAILWCSLYHALFIAPVAQSYGERLPFRGTVVDLPTETSYGVSVPMELTTAETSVPFHAIVYLDWEHRDLPLGAVVEATGNIRSSSIYHGQSSLSSFAKGIYATVNGVKDAAVTIPERTPLRLLPVAASHFLCDTAARFFSGDTLGLVQALLTGEKDSLSDSLYHSFQRSGIAHIVAVSGLHVAMLTQLLLLLPLPIRWKQVAVIPLLILFSLITGCRPSIVRAVLMETLILLGPVLKREYDPPTALSCALLLLLLQNPYAICGVGLQLSFTSVAGIELVTPELCQLFEDRAGPELKKLDRPVLSALVRGAYSSIAVSIGALLLSTLFIAIYFKSISLVGILTNLLVLPVMGVLFASSLFCVLLGTAFPALAFPFAFACKVISRYIFAVSGFFGGFPFAALSLEFREYQLWFWPFYGLTLLLLALQTPLKKPMDKLLRFSACISLPFLFLTILLHFSFYTEAPVNVMVLNVGQGQCIALFSGRETAVIDCGGNEGDAGLHIYDVMTGLERSQVDALILTHYDNDHTDGLSSLYQSMQVDHLYSPDLAAGGNEHVLKLANAHHTALDLVQTEQTISVGKATIRLLPAPSDADKENDQGMAVLISYREKDVLILGDLSSKGEAALLERYDLPDIEYMVAGHHGSKYSSSKPLLETVRPEIAVVSVGYNNYGHPTQEALDRFADIGCEVLRTDTFGNVLIQLEGWP